MMFNLTDYGDISEFHDVVAFLLPGKYDFGYLPWVGLGFLILYSVRELVKYYQWKSQPSVKSLELERNIYRKIFEESIHNTVSREQSKQNSDKKEINHNG